MLVSSALTLPVSQWSGSTPVQIPQQGSRLLKQEVSKGDLEEAVSSSSPFSAVARGTCLPRSEWFVSIGDGARLPGEAEAGDLGGFPTVPPMTPL